MEEERADGDWGRWSFEVGAGFTTENVLEEIFFGQWRRAKGEAAGEIYRFNVRYHVRELEWEVGRRVFRPQLEIPATLLIADERADPDPFFSYSSGLAVRWRDFPWNRDVYTTFATGLGLTYTQRVPQVERVRHPGRSRSHVRFYWPIEITVAHPRHTRHQLVFFLHHESGGQIFQRGGVNHLGLGYKYIFRAR